MLVGDRAPETSLYDDLAPALADGRLESLRLVGDADAPGLIAHAVFAGHLAAREFGDDIDPDTVPFRRERFTLPYRDARHDRVYRDLPRGSPACRASSTSDHQRSATFGCARSQPLRVLAP